MTRVNFFSVLLIISAIMFLPVTAKAQVTIGGTSDPHDFSILELISNDTRGFRLPQLTERQRDAMQATAEFQAQRDSLAMGLQIFNTCNQCVETWNGERWISFCFGEPQRPPVTPPHFDPDCIDEPECDPLRDFVATRLADVTNPDNHTANARPFSVGEVTFNMMPVTGGVFYMGVEAIDDASPNFDAGFADLIATYGGWVALGGLFATHLVGVNSFYIGQHEVTRGLFAAVMNFSGNTTGGHNLYPIANLPTSGPPWGWRYSDYPMTFVTWYHAIVFMNRLSVIMGRTPVYSGKGSAYNLLNPSYIPNRNSNNLEVLADWNAISKHPNWLNMNGFRLPTEAEWEYAARGGQMNEYTRTLGASGEQFLFSGSNYVDSVAWHSGKSGLQSRPVGQLQSNQLGIFDMSGNALEWVWDWLYFYPECCAVNPIVSVPSPEVEVIFGFAVRVYRGGCWHNSAAYSRVSIRSNEPPGAIFSTVGFRIAFSSVE